MRRRWVKLIGAAAVIMAVVLFLKLGPVPVAGQARPVGATAGAAAKTGPALTTPWGEPDLQGIWTNDYQIPLQRPAQYANKEFFTNAEIAALDKVRAKSLRLGDRAAARGTEQDVSGAYNSVYTTTKPTGRRTSLIVDPPDGRIPPATPEQQKKRKEIQDYQLALLQATDVCKDKIKSGGCEGGTYGPPSPRRAELPPYYMASAINRADGPEDRGMQERCMGFGLPGFGGTVGAMAIVGFFPRIVQSPGAVSIFYDVGQGWGGQRIIPITNTPHLPSNIRQWWGDSRGRWEGKTLVVDVTNFGSMRDFLGSRENLHLVERYTRIDAKTLEYVVTIEDPTTWTRPWTAKQEWTRQDEQANRVYYEPRCNEANYGLVGLLMGARADERAFAEGRGPDPATRCSAGCGQGFTEDDQDPLR